MVISITSEMSIIQNKNIFKKCAFFIEITFIFCYFDFDFHVYSQKSNDRSKKCLKLRNEHRRN